MAAIAALRTAFGALRRNPVLFLGGLLYGIVILPQSALQLAGIPLARTALQILTFFVTPFVIAGIIGMADEALDGDTSLGTLRAVGTDEYVPLLVGNFVAFAIAFVFGIVFVIAGVAVVLTVGISSLSVGAVGAGTLPLTGGVLLLIVLAYLLVSFFIQFYPVLIVLTDADAVGPFTESYGFVRRNLVSTLGYSVIRFVVSLAIAAPVTGFIVYRMFQNFDPSSATTGAGAGAGAGTAGAAGGFGALSGTALFSTPEVIALSLVSLALTMLGIAFQQAYAVSFYRRHAADAADPSEETSGDEYTAVDADDDGVSRTDDGVSRTDDGEWRYD